MQIYKKISRHNHFVNIFFHSCSFWHIFRPTVSPNPHIMNRGTVLIYSQHTLQATLLAAIVSDCHSQIICSSNLAHTIEICQAQKPPLIIFLNTAPFMNGQRLTESIRSIGHYHPTIYVISWQQSEHTVLSLLECGVDQYMTFPICMTRLRSKAATYLHP